MPEIFPFPAVRPIKNKVCLVPIQNFESIPRIEINRIIKTNPFSFLNIITGNYIQNLPVPKRYAAIRKRFNRFKKKKILIQDNIPFFYILRITSAKGDQFTGLIGLADVEDYIQGKIKKHEKTLEKRMELFAEYLKHVRIQSDPVLLAYDKHPLIEGLIQTFIHQIPEYEFSTTDGTVYEMWPVSEYALLHDLSRAFKEVDTFYIADGHHRMESTVKMREWMKAENPHHSGLESYNFVLSYFVPYQDLKIYSFSRGLKALNGQTVSGFIQHLSEKFGLRKLEKFSEPGPHEIVIVTQKDIFALSVPEQYIRKGMTDVDFLNDEIFTGILGFRDVRQNNKISYCETKESAKCISHKIKKGECKVGFFLHPITFEEIIKKAGAGQTLPPKSTYIEPKLLTGLMMYEF